MATFHVCDDVNDCDVSPRAVAAAFAVPLAGVKKRPATACSNSFKSSMGKERQAEGAAVAPD